MTGPKTVDVVEFPYEAAGVAHTFDSALPPRVTVRFAPASANLALSRIAGTALDMKMSLSIDAKGVLPACIKLCEPMCADSDVGTEYAGTDHARHENRIRHDQGTNPVL